MRSSCRSGHDTAHRSVYVLSQLHAVCVQLSEEEEEEIGQITPGDRYPIITQLLVAREARSSWLYRSLATAP